MATTTNYGWETPDNTDLVKDGALAMRDLGQDVDTQLFTALGGDYPGLRLVKKQTIGTGVSSVSLTDVFSATYDSYQVIINGGLGSSGSAYLDLKLTGSGSNYTWGITYNAYNATTTSDGGTSATGARFCGNITSTILHLNCEILNPFLPKVTFFSSKLNAQISGFHNSLETTNNSYTGLTITPTAGTLTGGTIYVYGYGAS